MRNHSVKIVIIQKSDNNNPVPYLIHKGIFWLLKKPVIKKDEIWRRKCVGEEKGEGIQIEPSKAERYLLLSLYECDLALIRGTLIGR